MLLAEQIAINCPPSTVEEILSHRPVDWLTPLLRLAADEGEAAGMAVLPRRPRQALRERRGGGRQKLEADAPARDAHAVRVHIRWCTSDYSVLFTTLDAVLLVRALERGTVLGVEGAYELAPALLESHAGASAARRAAESAVRSLLGHLRAAMESEATRIA